MSNKVEVTPEVITLIENLTIERRSDTPQISSKRPFGNSDYYKQVLELTDQHDEYTNDYGAISDEGKEVVEDLLSRTKTAFKILLYTRNLEEGVYEPSGNGWQKVE